MKKILLIFLTALMMLAVAACTKKPDKDPNAVLTDSDIPLDLGAQLVEDTTESDELQ